MYVVTFYSFKGGVGRTMALANVAFELARRGRRVLAVDFDLEAPGLDSFGLFGRKTAVGRGVLDYITEYVATSETPDVREFVRESALDVAGKLWIMPAGQSDGSYSYRLSQVDWTRLYEEHDGYLALEDLKAQWEREFQPDYVLIDSRTGHTDVGGICTRQLPDSVVVLFFPNDQNLRGLQRVVDEIRAEAQPPRNKEISLHFAMSNVPDIDDEDRILASKIARFRHVLGIDRLHTIHRYDSLALLSQAVFTKDRPRSRLAREYRKLVDGIVKENIQDREGALTLLSGLGRISIDEEPDERELEKVAAAHSADAEVLEALARVRIRQGRVDEAVRFVDRAVELGGNDPRALTMRALCRRVLGQAEGALDDIRGALSLEGAGRATVAEALRVYRKFDAAALADVVQSEAAHGLPAKEKVWLAEQLNCHRVELELARRVLDELGAEPSSDELAHDRARIMTLVLIGLCSFDQALPFIPPFTDASPIDEVFNRAMAEWGARGEPNIGLFQRVRELSLSRSGDFEGANYLECIALSHAVESQVEETQRFVRRARRTLGQHREFSCWRYLAVPEEAFADDLEAILRLANGERSSPAFGVANTLPSTSQ